MIIDIFSCLSYLYDDAFIFKYPASTTVTMLGYYVRIRPNKNQGETTPFSWGQISIDLFVIICLFNLEHKSAVLFCWERFGLLHVTNSLVLSKFIHKC